MPAVMGLVGGGLKAANARALATPAEANGNHPFNPPPIDRPVNGADRGSATHAVRAWQKGKRNTHTK